MCSLPLLGSPSPGVALRYHVRSPAPMKLPCWSDHVERPHRDRGRHLGAPAVLVRRDFDHPSPGPGHVAEEALEATPVLNHHLTANQERLPSQNHPIEYFPNTQHIGTMRDNKWLLFSVTKFGSWHFPFLIITNVQREQDSSKAFKGKKAI